MNSIYSIQALQRILDRFHAGKIEYCDQFKTIGSNAWLHFITTNQGDFELYSFPTDTPINIQDLLIERRLGEKSARSFKNMVHKFDRTHQLFQANHKYKITPKQIATEFQKFENKRLTKSFRVYGTILDLRFGDELTIWSYAYWNLQKKTSEITKILLDSHTSNYDEIDEIVEKLPKKDLYFEKYIIEDEWVELFFNNGYSLHFKEEDRFAAIEMIGLSKDLSASIFSEERIFYIKDLKRSS